MAKQEKPPLKAVSRALWRAAAKHLRWFMEDLLPSEWPPLKLILDGAGADYLMVHHRDERNVCTVCCSIDPGKMWGDFVIRFASDVGHAFGECYLQRGPIKVECSPLFAEIVGAQAPKGGD